MNHREILGVDANATKADIKQAFRNAAKEQHPDLSNSPEAAEAFAKIKKAHDALMQEADAPRESSTVATASARASAATSRAAYQQTTQDPAMSAEDVAHTQELDTLARRSARSLFRRNKESDEVRRHRKKLRTNERRLRGLY